MLWPVSKATFTKNVACQCVGAEMRLKPRPLAWRVQKKAKPAPLPWPTQSPQHWLESEAQMIKFIWNVVLFSAVLPVSVSYGTRYHAIQVFGESWTWHMAGWRQMNRHWVISVTIVYHSLLISISQTGKRWQLMASRYVTCYKLTRTFHINWNRNCYQRYSSLLSYPAKTRSPPVGGADKLLCH